MIIKSASEPAIYHRASCGLVWAGTPPTTAAETAALPSAQLGDETVVSEKA